MSCKVGNNRHISKIRNRKSKRLEFFCCNKHLWSLNDLKTPQTSILLFPTDVPEQTVREIPNELVPETAANYEIIAAV